MPRGMSVGGPQTALPGPVGGPAFELLHPEQEVDVLSGPDHVLDCGNQGYLVILIGQFSADQETNNILRTFGQEGYHAWQLWLTGYVFLHPYGSGISRHQPG